MKEADAQLNFARCKPCNKPFRYAVIAPLPMILYAEDMISVRCPYCGNGPSGIGVGGGLSLEENRLILQPKARLEIRAANWMLQGETGLSSLAIHAHMTDRSLKYYPAPRDLSDLRRCILLLQHVPEWSDRMPEMQKHEEWKVLGPRFSDLQRLYLSEAPNLDQAAPAAHELFEELSKGTL